MKWLVVLVVLSACDAEPLGRSSQVDAPAVIALAVEPAEVAPGEDVTVTVHVATPDGPADAAEAAWALCVSPRPVTDDNAVAADCTDDGVEPIAATGPTITTPLSIDACARFGPSPPPGGFRPRDPDPTGGYYQPVRVEVDGLTAFAMARVYCGLANAPLAETTRYADEYTRNLAPVIDALDAPATIAPGETIELSVRWPDGALEPYLRYDADAQILETVEERVTVSWFATGGDFDLDRSVGAATGTTNAWAAPESAGPVHVWAVARDDRGGQSAAHVIVTVE